MDRDPVYRYIVADLLTDETYGMPILTDVSFERRISRAGSFQGTMVIANRDHAVLANKMSAWVGRTSLWVYRNKQLWWGGVLWVTGPSRDGSSFKMDVTAATYESFAARREIRGGVDDGSTLHYTDQDQGHIMPALWNALQGADGSNSNIGVIAPPVNTGVIISVAYPRSEVNHFETAIEAIGDAVQGPEHTIDVFVGEDGNRKKKFRVGWPRLGNDAPTKLILGNQVPAWSRTNDATEGATSFQARGASIRQGGAKDATPLMSNVYEDVYRMNHGWPRLDATADHTKIRVKSHLNDIAQAFRDRSSVARVVPLVSANIETTGWHPNHIGDPITIKYAKNDLFKPGQREILRPVAVTVVPPAEGSREVIQFAVTEE